jgi:hypothetical protein
LSAYVITTINNKMIMVFNFDNLRLSNISGMYFNIMAKKTPRKEEERELEHEQAKEEIHQAELEEGYEQDDKFEESKD